MASNQTAERYEAQCRLNEAIRKGDLKDISVLRAALVSVPYTEDDEG